MSERERLIKLLGCKYNCVDRNKCLEEQADNLLENGVIVPPVEVGQTVYVIDHTSNELSIFRCGVTQISIESDDIYFHLDWGEVRPRLSCVSIDKVGEIVFLTKEEAEKALKGDTE